MDVNDLNVVQQALFDRQCRRGARAFAAKRFEYKRTSGGCSMGPLSLVLSKLCCGYHNTSFDSTIVYSFGQPLPGLSKDCSIVARPGGPGTT